ncbi:MAG: hypothetical protein K2Z80_21385, partial [Xanthobacteraceae bacterium]|nr:hypothetical protein [Xanthobacteraceae bacterium]
MLSAIDRNHWPPSIGMAGRFHRNPHAEAGVDIKGAEHKTKIRVIKCLRAAKGLGPSRQYLDIEPGTAMAGDDR